MFTDSNDSNENFLTFSCLEVCVVCTVGSTAFAPLLGDFSILACTLCQSVTHQNTLLCVCQTHVLEMWPSISLRVDKLHVGVLQRCTNSSAEFHFHCSNFDPLSMLPCFTFIPLSTFTLSSVILKSSHGVIAL